MAGVQTEFLFEASLALGEVYEVGATPNGIRRIRNLQGGTFAGPKLRGEVLPGGADWLLLRPDGARAIDVRVTLRTDDGHPIYLISRGIFHILPEAFQRIASGEPVDPSEYYFRTTPLFETAAEEYDWLNRIVAVSLGRFTETAVIQAVYAVL